METIIVASVFLAGAIIASFMGVVAARLNTGQGFLLGRSACDACSAYLNPSSLVPIVSFLVSRGRAACCGARISALSPVSELALGILYVLSYLALGLTPGLFVLLGALSLLLALVSYDLAHQILPPQLLYPFVGLSILMGASAYPSDDWYGILLVAACIGASLLALHLLSRGRAMGFADAPLAFGLAVLAGPVALTGFVFSFWIGAVVGIALLARRPAGSRIGVEVPFAPFLACGFLLAFFTQWNLFTYLTSMPR